MGFLIKERETEQAKPQTNNKEESGILNCIDWGGAYVIITKEPSFGLDIFGNILLDGIEYLITNNDIQRILRFIEMVHEKIVLNNGVFFIPTNPTVVSKNDIELLENELANTIRDPTLNINSEIQNQ